MPIIYLNDDIRNTCIDKLRLLIFYFSAQTRDELLQFFPTEKEGLIDKSLEILESRHEIQQKEYMGMTLYYEKRRYETEFQKYWDRRIHFKPTLDFIRTTLNSTDSKGFLINDIPYLGIGNNPGVVYFSSNNKVYEIYNIHEEDWEFQVKQIQTRDKYDEYITEPNNPRIVILDNENYQDHIVIKNIAYFAIYNEEERSFIMKEGTYL